MDRNLLFVETLNDLRQKLEQPSSEYNVLKVSALLRQLLLDSPRLVDVVREDWKKRHGKKFKIVYRIAIGGAYEQAVLALKPAIWAVADGLYPPDALASKPVRPVSLDDLLRTRILIVGEYQYTVKDIIRQLAHVEGGVHAGTPEDDKELLLTSIGHQVSIGGHSMVVASVRAVGKVVYAALQPLKDQLEQELLS